MRRKIKIGDIIRITTSKGFVYSQYLLKIPKWGALIRILPGFFKSEKIDYITLAKSKELFVAIFPLQTAVNQEIVDVVSNEIIPAESQTLPKFRSPGFVDRNGKVSSWYLWDGENEYRVEKITEDFKKLPILEVVNDTLLIERIENGWLPEKDI